MKATLNFLGVILAALAALALGSVALLALAYGIGWLVNWATGFGMLPSAFLGLAGIFVFIYLTDRAINVVLSTPPYQPYSEFEDDFGEDDFDDEYDDEDGEFEDAPKLSAAEQEELDRLYAGIPRWRRPTKNLDFSNVKPDDRCPCGSGRKFKNCHGKNKNA